MDMQLILMQDADNSLRILNCRALKIFAHERKIPFSQISYAIDRFTAAVKFDI